MTIGFVMVELDQLDRVCLIVNGLCLEQWWIKMGWSNEWKDKPSLPNDLVDVGDGWKMHKSVVDKINNEWDDCFNQGWKEDGRGRSIVLLIETEGQWPIKIEAQQIGDLAVHKPIPDVQGMWRQITHVPTMTMFDKALPTPEPPNLLWWIAEVQKSHQELWAELRALTCDNYRDSAQQAKNIILKHCQSVRAT